MPPDCMLTDEEKMSSFQVCSCLLNFVRFRIEINLYQLPIIACFLCGVVWRGRFWCLRPSSVIDITLDRSTNGHMGTAAKKNHVPPQAYMYHKSFCERSRSYRLSYPSGRYRPAPVLLLHRWPPPTESGGAGFGRNGNNSHAAGESKIEGTRHNKGSFAGIAIWKSIDRFRNLCSM